MKSTLFTACLCCLLLVLGVCVESFGQVAPASTDTTQVGSVLADTTSKKGMSKPAKAALLSAIVPGLGQAYNNSYWKIPIIYATGAVMGYFLKSNHQGYQDYKQALNLRLDGIAENDQDQFTDRLKNLSPEQQINALKRGRDTYRRWRDYTVLYSLAAYGLNITEAYVHAHLKGFDISEELTIKLRPDMIQTRSYSFTPAFSLSINLKK